MAANMLMFILAILRVRSAYQSGSSFGLGLELKMREICCQRGKELQSRENGENCAQHQFWKPLYATVGKTRYTAAKTIEKLCKNDSEMLQIR